MAAQVRFAPLRMWGVQVAAAVIAGVAVSTLFGGGPGPVVSTASQVADSGKSVRRVADGTIEATVVRYDSQQQALRASLASFTPTVAPTAAVATAAPRVATVAKPAITVLPPPRPIIMADTPVASLGVDAAPPVVVSTARAAAPQGWRVAGIEIPGSARVRRLIPSGSDIVETGDAAWTASTKVVRQVATLGGLFGL